MQYEIDFLAVGNSDKSGDAIAVRFGNLDSPNGSRVVVVDAGFQENGTALVEHIRHYYQTNVVDLVVSTHPDNDHIGGLATVLNEMQVRELWMHLPWKHSGEMASYYASGRIGDATCKAALKRSLEAAVDLERVARAKGIPIQEPFTGRSAFGGALWVLGPTESYYQSLLPDFRGAPEQSAGSKSVLESLLAGAREVVGKLAEHWGYETLTDSGETTAENNSSAILLFSLGDDTLLLTADAGMPALSQAADVLDQASFNYNSIRFIQVPHHGSQRNVGPTILNRLLGPHKPEGTVLRAAFVSCAKDGAPKHPAKKVTNAFLRRGAAVHVTQGSKKYYFKNTPNRGWSPSMPLPMYAEVED